MDLASAAHELYGVRPGEFMETRRRLTAEARSAGDAALAKEIERLRKPTVSAWAVNRLSRSAGRDLAMLLDLGIELRAAWTSGHPISGLEQRRGEMVALLVRTAGDLASDAGRPLRDTALREVENTLQAAAVDPEVAEEVRLGRLDKPRSHSGFIPPGFPPPPAPRKPAVPQKPSPKEDRERRAEAARAAERKVKEAEQALAEWRSEVTAAQETLTALTAEAGELRRRLNEALERQAAAERRLHVAQREQARASRTAEEAHRKAEEAAGKYRRTRP